MPTKAAHNLLYIYIMNEFFASSAGGVHETFPIYIDTYRLSRRLVNKFSGCLLHSFIILFSVRIQLNQFYNVSLITCRSLQLKMTNVSGDGKPAAAAGVNSSQDRDDQWGYDLYPERRGDVPPVPWWQIAFFGAGRTTIDRVRCERNVYNCFQNSKRVCIYEILSHFYDRVVFL